VRSNPEVESWFKGKAAEPALRRVRDIIMQADPRMTEYVKYGTVQFGYEGDFANFVQHGKKTVTLMFNRGARIPGKFAHLEGEHPSARFMRFGDVKELETRRSELGRIARAWCDLVSNPNPKAATAPKAQRRIE
jgi:hypothetical protein